jgi:hypothetical protein
MRKYSKILGAFSMSLASLLGFVEVMVMVLSVNLRDLK